MSTPEALARRPTILIVEDDADLRGYLARGLGHLARIAEASDGLGALAVLAAEPVALVITGLYLPRMDGRTLCRAMQADPALATVPVLLITGDAELDLPGVCGTLRKPFNARFLQQQAAPHLRAP